VHILIGIPSSEYVHTDFALKNLPDIVQHTQQVMPDCKIAMIHKRGVRTDANRNAILAEAIKDRSIDYILWLDADMIYPLDIVVKYVKATYPLINRHPCQP
jgi:hypothetical protein